MDNEKVIGKTIRTLTKSSFNTSEFLKCPEGFVIHRVSKVSNVFELKKFCNTYYIYVNGKQLARTTHEDIANHLFTTIITRF